MVDANKLHLEASLVPFEDCCSLLAILRWFPIGGGRNLLSTLAKGATSRETGPEALSGGKRLAWEGNSLLMARVYTLVALLS